jgi:hypothetical protein
MKHNTNERQGSVCVQLCDEQKVRSLKQWQTTKIWNRWMIATGGKRKLYASQCNYTGIQ